MTDAQAKRRLARLARRAERQRAKCYRIESEVRDLMEVVGDDAADFEIATCPALSILSRLDTVARA